MNLKKFKVKKPGLIIGAVLIVVVAGIAIWGGTGGWLQGSVQALKPLVRVTYMHNTGGGALQDGIYANFTPNANDPVWCMMVENKSVESIEMNKVVFADKLRKDGKKALLDKYDKWEKHSGVQKKIDVILINFPYSANLARLDKSDYQSPPRSVTIVADHSQNKVRGGKDYSAFYPWDFVKGTGLTKIDAGKTGYFCLLYNSQDFMKSASKTADIKGQAQLSDLEFKNKSGNMITKSRIEFVNPEVQKNTIMYQDPQWKLK